MSHKRTIEQQDQLIALLVAGSNITQACKTLGIRRQCYHQWLNENDQNFRDRYQQARAEKREFYKNKLEMVVSDAIASLEKDLSDDDWRCRQGAARLLLEAFNAAKLVAIEEKLNQLENGGYHTIDI
jgi:hypothetical protein